METISIAEPHGGNPPASRERQSFDHLLIGNDKRALFWLD